MSHIETRLSSLNAIATAFVVLASLLTPAGVYSLVTYSDLNAEMSAEAHITAEAFNNIIAHAPELWRFQEVRFTELIQRRLPEDERAKKFLRIIDNNEAVVAAVGTPPTPPVIAHSETLFDSGRPVGRLEIQRSLRSQIVNAGLLFVLGLLLAAGSFVTLRVIPMRAVQRANEALHRDAEELMREVEERKRGEAALRESQQIVRAMLDTVPARIFWKDKNLVYLGCNAPFARDAGFSHPEDVVGKDDYQMGWRDQATLYRGGDRQVIESGLSKLLTEEPQTTPDGKTVTLLTSKVPLRSSNGEIFGVLGTYVDVTERARLQQQLSFSNLLNTTAIENAPDAILVVDENARIISFNTRFIKLWNAPQELMDRGEDGPVLQILAAHFADLEAFRARVKYLYEHTHEKAHDELKLNDGRVIDRHTAPLRDADQKYLGRIWFFRDITERRRTEEALRKSHAMLMTTERLASIGGWEWEVSGDDVQWSDELYRIFGRTPKDFTPTVSSFVTCIHPDDRQHMQDSLAAALTRHAPYDVEFRVIRPDGTQRVVHTCGELTFDKAGTPVRMTGTAHDITERKNAEQALHRRDLLLHAAAMSATDLVTTASLDDAIRKSLELIGTAFHVDRIVVLERPPNHVGAPVLRYVWESSSVTVKVDQGFFKNPAVETAEFAAWEAPLRKGRIVTTDVRTADGDVKRMFEQLGVKKNLVVPIMVDGKYWGQLGFDSCDQERIWADFEIEILQTLAELIGTAIQRDRYVKELADANRIVQNTPTILYRLRCEPSFPMIYISQNIKLLGYEPAALIASPRLLQSIVHPDDVTAVRESLTKLLEKDGQRGVLEFRLMTGHGDYRWVENRYAPIRDEAGRLVEIEGLLIDITERKAAEEKISRLARTDPLTGLPNRATFIERLQNLFAAARRGAVGFAVLYLDLDRFKDINDTLGHPVGDRLLITVGERLSSSVRETDVVARLGGDEFAVLQADLTDTTDAGTLAVKIRAALAEPIQIAGNELRITASIGISIYAPDIAMPEDMLAQADVALYRAKEEGRDQYRFHTEDLDVEVRQQIAMTDQLRAALERDEFELHYQPQVELSTGKIVGMEALIRWNHPTRGRLMPAAFIAIADRTGISAAIGHWVLGHACRQMSLWRQAGIAPSSLAVNISPAQIRNGDEFLAFVTGTLAKWQIPPEALELDVTESMLARATLAQNDVLERLHKLGVKISIDDFGTKYSTLDYLRTYRVSRLKIPQALTISAARNPDSAAMVRAIVGIARELNIEVIAQGVETEAQWSFLTATSPVTKVQGYYYSKPVPAERADELLRRRRIALRPVGSDRRLARKAPA